MTLKRIIATLARFCGLASSLAAGRSDLADAVMKGDKAVSERSSAEGRMSMRHKQMVPPRCTGPLTEMTRNCRFAAPLPAQLKAANRAGDAAYLASLNGSAAMIGRLLRRAPMRTSADRRAKRR